MKYDEFGQVHISDNELARLIHVNPSFNIGMVLVDDPEKFNEAVTIMFDKYPQLSKYVYHTGTVTDFDKTNQNNWHMTKKYHTLDIAKWLFDQCETQEQKQRVGQELLMYGERNLLNMLQFLKYMIDVFRENDIIWGVGRGSSVSSYVLFLIGVHKVDSMYYDLDINEFLR